MKKERYKCANPGCTTIMVMDDPTRLFNLMFFGGLCSRCRKKRREELSKIKHDGDAYVR